MCALRNEDRICHELHRLFGDTVSEDILRVNACAIAIAPRTTTIRVNTLLVSVEVALESLSALLVAQGRAFSVSLSNHSNCVLEVPALGPFSWIPVERRMVVSSECAQAVLRGADIYASGVLAIEDDVDFSNSQEVSVWADLNGSCTRGLRKRYSGAVMPIANARLSMARDIIFCDGAQGLAAKITETEWMMPSFEGLSKEWYYPQNLPSVLAVQALDVRPGMRVLDMCASPGGKSSYIAALMENKGELIAVDKKSNKTARLGQTLANLGVSCAKILTFDATRLDSLYEESSFDRILLDPPCSGIGKRPLILKTRQTMQASGYAEYQCRLLDVASKLLRPGGILVYSTCTMMPAENEQVAEYAVRHCGLISDPMDGHLGDQSLIGKDASCHASAMRRFMPAGELDTIAFFFARFRKATC